MFDNTTIATLTYYYPLGNTLAVCLTQDLPPEQDADILCLGCGDARNILFTCFADSGRKIDVTCCDIEPGIHARNILLYSLLIDDKANCNLDRIWNIYYHWKLDRASADLLEEQSSKLLQIAESIDSWHGSIYGSCVRFCDNRSLTLVKSYWKGFQLRGLSPSEKEDRLRQLQVAIGRAKAAHEKELGDGVNVGALRSASPIGIEALKDLSEVTKQWWNHGTTLSALKAADLNPAFLYTLNQATTLHYGLSPLLGFPLCTAYVPIVRGDPFHLERCKDTPSAEHLVNSAKRHFKQWVSAFRKAVNDKLVIRVFCGDALNFGCTLRHCQLTGTTSMNLFCDNWSNSPLKLGSDYSNLKNAAPVSFDVVDTSNLADHLGPLNLIGIASSLLKPNTSSSLYTEMLVQNDASLTDRLSGLFGVDVRAMSMLFGLVLPELFTNAIDTIEDNPMTGDLLEMIHGVHKQRTQIRSRIRWKRLLVYRESYDAPYLHVEARALAALLIQLHDSMFRYEDPAAKWNALKLNPKSVFSEAHVYYNRSSFALCLNLLRATVITDWNQCVKLIYESCLNFSSLGSLKSNCWQDLLLNMNLCGVNNGTFRTPTRADLHAAILAPVLPISANEDIPEQVSVTIRILREKLEIFTSKQVEEIGTPAIVCSLQGQEPSGRCWLNLFSAVQVAFGKWHAQTNEESYPYIVEDHSRLHGSSDMFVSVIVPTWMLLTSKCSVPLAKVGVMSTMENACTFARDFGLDLCFVREKMTSENVFVTRFMPGMSALPTFIQQNKAEPTSNLTTVLLTDDGSKAKTLTQRFTLESAATKVKLADKSSTVNAELKSPMTAAITIAKSETLILKLPLPLSLSKPNIRIARKSSYVEVENSLFDPLQEDASMFIFPAFITDSSIAPTLWTSSRLDLDVMPPVDLSSTEAISWLTTHTTLMFSNRERHIRQSNVNDLQCRGTLGDPRTDLKEGLFSLFMHYTGLQGVKSDFFALVTTNSGIQSLIFPSCLRLDLINHTVVLDAALIPLSDAMIDDFKVNSLLRKLLLTKMCRIRVTEAENLAWKALMPALVERCRKWKHNRGCEYNETGEIPLPRKPHDDSAWSICTCGVGKFPTGDYLESLMKRFSELSYIVRNYGTRVAIGPIFPVPYVEDCFLKGIVSKYGLGRSILPKCAKCGGDQQKLLVCSRCKIVKYCSKECQKSDYKVHKLRCKAA